MKRLSVLASGAQPPPHPRSRARIPSQRCPVSRSCPFAGCTSSEPTSQQRSSIWPECSELRPPYPKTTIILHLFFSWLEGLDLSSGNPSLTAAPLLVNDWGTGRPEPLSNGRSHRAPAKADSSRVAKPRPHPRTEPPGADASSRARTTTAPQSTTAARLVRPCSFSSTDSSCSFSSTDNDGAAKHHRRPPRPSLLLPEHGQRTAPPSPTSSVLAPS